MIALTAARLYTPLECLERPLVLIEGQNITHIATQDSATVPVGAELVDFGNAVLAPGLVDIHIHGSAGYDVMSADAADITAIERFLAGHGVTTYFPTTVTASIDEILSALDRLGCAVQKSKKDRELHVGQAQPLGIHLEGPFLSHVRRGVHPPAQLLRPSLELFERFWQAARGHIRFMTIAPELEDAKEVIAEATGRGVCVSLGHTNADLETTRAAIAAGARHATHTFNAMRPLDHREPGVIGQMLADSRVSADIIADGVHLHPTIVELFLKTKGSELSVLITDATAAAGMPDGRYRLGTLDVEVKDGKCTAEGKLAGSVLTLDHAVRNVMQFAGWDLQHALRPASLNAARVARLTDRGKLEAGCFADIAVLSSRGEVINTIVHGATMQAVARI